MSSSPSTVVGTPQIPIRHLSCHCPVPVLTALLPEVDRGPQGRDTACTVDSTLEQESQESKPCPAVTVPGAMAPRCSEKALRQGPDPGTKFPLR